MVDNKQQTNERKRRENSRKNLEKCAPADKETWWWNEEVQAAVKTKKTLIKRIWDRTGDQGDKQRHKRAKADARRKVAQAKSRAWDDLYKELESPRGRKSLFQLAKQRNKASKDFTRIKQMKNEQGQVLMVDEEIRKRWQD